jgi:hypothetical protein
VERLTGAGSRSPEKVDLAGGEVGSGRRRCPRGSRRQRMARRGPGGCGEVDGELPVVDSLPERREEVAGGVLRGGGALDVDEVDNAACPSTNGGVMVVCVGVVVATDNRTGAVSGLTHRNGRRKGLSAAVVSGRR